MVIDRKTIPCKWCGKQTPMLGTKMCDNCWELSHRIKMNFELAGKMIAFYHPFKKEKTMKTPGEEIRVDNAEQDIQEIKDLLQQTDDAIEEFFKSPYRNERAINFLNGKALAYRKALKILRN